MRVVGPAFEKVSSWAAQGVPLAVAFKGIDRYCERYYAKGPRRRPVRVEFCEADVLDLFDAWRRAVGVTSLDGEEETVSRKPDPLPSHIDRAIARLTALRSSGRARCARRPPRRGRPRTGSPEGVGESRRGETREPRSSIGWWRSMRALLDVARAQLDRRGSRGLAHESGSRNRPVRRAHARGVRAIAAVEAAFTRLMRDSAGLPVLSLG